MNTKYDIALMKSLRSEGKTFKEISKLLECSYHTVVYHLSPDRKLKQRAWAKESYHNLHLVNKLNAFKKYGNTIDFSLKELMDKIGPSPICFYTKLPIDINDSSSYSLDHKIPRSRGGSSNLDNLIITTSATNKAKHNLLCDEFIALCKLVAANN
jgi:5-methylcytosine-specific restriction endonuclease McrA